MNSIINASFSHAEQLINKRKGETKLGEQIILVENNIQRVEDLSALLENITSKFIILGVPEDIGIRANHGQGGAISAYDTFLTYFLNMQSNQYIEPKNICILGDVNVYREEASLQHESDVQKLRKGTEIIDEFVFPIIKAIHSAGKIPIVIGGGHNNSYPIIKGVSSSLRAPLDVFNIDPHFDVREMEGRHSGNGFSYAFHEKLLKNYSVWGFHPQYNNQYSLDFVAKESQIRGYDFFDILKKKASLTKALDEIDKTIGLEIDLDAIKNMPSSAQSPIGFSEVDILILVEEILQKKELHYCHIAEGIAKNDELKVGKFLGYLVWQIVTILG